MRGFDRRSPQTGVPKRTAGEQVRDAHSRRLPRGLGSGNVRFAPMEPRIKAAAPAEAPPPDLQDLIRVIEARGIRVQVTPGRKQGR